MTDTDRVQLAVTFLLPLGCTCCGSKTWIRLKGVPLCSACGVSAINARSRQLLRDPATAAVAWPVEPIHCNKRGHKAAHLVQRSTS
jgi:hypothetical protein